MENNFLEYSNLEKYDLSPKAKGLITSFRSIGYTVETAISDILDNSIAAAATNIKIYFDWNRKKIFIIDNGKGMSKEELLNAMALSGADPFLIRKKEDMGRFGMGMKTASFSIGKNLLVISKKNDNISNVFWDIDYVVKNESWQTLSWNKEEINVLMESLPDKFKQVLNNDGTLLIISKLDKLIDEINIEKSKKIFYETIESVKKHIALYFHRFIEEDNLKISVNDDIIEPWNPFFTSNIATQELPVEKYEFDGKKVKIEPYILPHECKFKNSDDFNYAGRENWNRYQGFYVYRNKRLIEYGTWFKKLRKESGYRLARIKIDIESESDKDWNIDILKSKVTLPTYLRDIIVRVASESARRSLEIYNSRGTYKKRENSCDKEELTFVWEQKKNSNGKYSFYLNKLHPLLKKLINNLDADNGNILRTYLKLVESYMPAYMSGIINNSYENKQNDSDIRNIDIMEIKQLAQNLIKAGIKDEEIITVIKGIKGYSYLSKEIPYLIKEIENE